MSRRTIIACTLAIACTVATAPPSPAARGGIPGKPVWRGEIQGPLLGMAVEVFDDSGSPAGPGTVGTGPLSITAVSSGPSGIMAGSAGGSVPRAAR
mgnify:CR=1 FL=1